MLPWMTQPLSDTEVSVKSQPISTHFIRILDKEVSLPPSGLLGDKPIFCAEGLC